jgi:hypothetical protein
VEARLGFAVIEATSANKPFACRCCATTSTHADEIGRHCETDPLAESEGLTAEVVPTYVPHTDVAGVETTLERGHQVAISMISAARVTWSFCITRVSTGNGRNMTSPDPPDRDSASNAMACGSEIRDTNCGS